MTEGGGAREMGQGRASSQNPRTHVLLADRFAQTRGRARVANIFFNSRRLSLPCLHFCNNRPQPTCSSVSSATALAAILPSAGRGSASATSWARGREAAHCSRSVGLPDRRFKLARLPAQNAATFEWRG